MLDTAPSPRRYRFATSYETTAWALNFNPGLQIHIPIERIATPGSAPRWSRRWPVRKLLRPRELWFRFGQRFFDFHTKPYIKRLENLLRSLD